MMADKKLRTIACEPDIRFDTRAPGLKGVKERNVSSIVVVRMTRYGRGVSCCVDRCFKTCYVDSMWAIDYSNDGPVSSQHLIQMSWF